jgi:hypothetical protein
MSDPQQQIKHIEELATTARLHEQHVTKHRWRLAQTYVQLYRLLSGKPLRLRNAALTDRVTMITSAPTTTSAPFSR